MCWTQRKADKLNYFRKTLMWYLDDSVANVDTLGNSPSKSMLEKARNPLRPFHSPPGTLERAKQQWELLSRKICKRSDNSP